MTKPEQNLYLGVDIGGTKIQVSLVTESGLILSRARDLTPRDCAPEALVETVATLVKGFLKKQGLAAGAIKGVGVGVPGVVDSGTGVVAVTPNMSLCDTPVGEWLAERLGTPVVVGNDCNVAVMGEKWLGAGRQAHSVVGVFPGTGIGGGFAIGEQLWRGAREAAMEIGHMIMQIDGPKCGCGNRGCLEALASRSAIEKQIRAAVKNGRKTILTDLLQNDLSLIRSGSLKKALDANDKTVVAILKRAAEVIGLGCVNLRHILDPEVFILGGGVIAACGDFMIPIIEKVLAADALPGARSGGRVLMATLGDDAGVLGCVALVRIRIGRSPFRAEFAAPPDYAPLSLPGAETVQVGETTYDVNIMVRADGRPKKKKKLTLPRDSEGRQITWDNIESACQGGPAVLFVGVDEGPVRLAEEAQRCLERRAIRCEVGSLAEVAANYNACELRRAALLVLRP